MAEPSNNRKELMDEIVNSKKMGDKKFHSDTSLQKFDDDDEVGTPEANKDPGVLNLSLNSPPSPEDDHRRRTMSQPGPVSGSLLTASAARAARKRPPRNVAYASDLENNDYNDKLSPKILPKDNESGTATPTGDPNSPLPFNGNYRNGDVKSLNSYRLYTSPNEFRGGTTPRKRSVATMDAQSIRSVETHAPPPTPPEVNKRLTIKYLSLISSCMYAILLVTVGLIIYIGDHFIDLNVSVYYSMVLCAIGFLYHIYLIYDISRYKTIALKNQKIRGLHAEQINDYFMKQEEIYGTPNIGNRTPEGFKPAIVPPPVLLPITHDYCFSHGRHSGSFYLKLGAAGFALGHLIHSMLLIAVQISSIFDDNIDNDDCIEYAQVALDFLFPLYCFLQLYFIFKYSNVIILKGQSVAHFAFMHMIGSSLCFWVSAIVRETVLALTLYANSTYGSNNYTTQVTDSTYVPEEELSRIIDIGNLYNPECIGPPTISNIYENVSPYLYPFSVEFNILIVAVYYIIWSNIGNCHSEDNDADSSSDNDNFSICKIPTANEDNDFTSNIVIHADCHASNRGLFVGLIVVVIVSGMLILGFVFSSVGGEFQETGYLLNSCTQLSLHTVMLVAVIVAYRQTAKLDINEHPISLLDDILLFICLPAFFMETLFSMIATVTYLNIVRSIDIVMMVIQVIIQTTMLVDGLRRCSNSKKLRRTKPGRELVMFLIIANVAMWLFNTFSYKAPDRLDERYEMYGKVTWSILGHISLPLIMFYRFHSSVCYADIWNSAYKPGSEH